MPGTSLRTLLSTDHFVFPNVAKSQERETLLFGTRSAESEQAEIWGKILPPLNHEPTAGLMHHDL
jgi:hypothetical protein